MSEYKVDLDVYHGPLDLLLYLIRRDEIDIYDIPIAHITTQYIQYVRLLERIDPDFVSEFLIMAATLMEIKSRTMLPRPPVEVGEEEDFSDPRLELVRQLLEYKQYKDAAHALGASAEIQALKHPRAPAHRPMDPQEVDLEEVQVWDLFEAFQKVLDSIGRRSYKHEVLYDDTPIALHAADIVDSLERCGGSQRFQSLFEGRTKSQMIGLFLALLELVRQLRVKAVQPAPFQPIELQLLDASPVDIDEDAALGRGTGPDLPGDDEDAASESDEDAEAALAAEALERMEAAQESELDEDAGDIGDDADDDADEFVANAKPLTVHLAPQSDEYDEGPDDVNLDDENLDDEQANALQTATAENAGEDATAEDASDAATALDDAAEEPGALGEYPVDVTAADHDDDYEIDLNALYRNADDDDQAAPPSPDAADDSDRDDTSRDNTSRDDTDRDNAAADDAAPDDERKESES